MAALLCKNCQRDLSTNVNASIVVRLSLSLSLPDPPLSSYNPHLRNLVQSRLPLTLPRSVVDPRSFLLPSIVVVKPPTTPAKTETQCAETGINLCLVCFSSGVEIGEHKANMKYRVHDNKHAMKIFKDDWSAYDELALLDAIMKYGLGNWKDIAVAVGKSERRCEDHYLDDYLGVYGRILPPTTISRPGGAVATDDLLAEEQRLAASREAYDAACAASAVERAAAEADGTAKDLPLGPDFDKPPGTAFPRERLREKPRATVQQVTEKISKLPGAALGGYMPLRGDFDVEHDNEVSDGWSGRVCACGRAEWTGTGNAITRNKQ